VKVPSGVLIPAGICYEIGSSLLDAVAERYSRDGRPVPQQVRTIGLEVWEVGRLVAARRSPSIPASVPALDESDSPSSGSQVMTCSTKQAATRLEVSSREVRFLRERGRLGGQLINGRLRIPIADVDALVAERIRND